MTPSYWDSTWISMISTPLTAINSTCSTTEWPLMSLAQGHQQLSPLAPCQHCPWRMLPSLQLCRQNLPYLPLRVCISRFKTPGGHIWLTDAYRSGENEKLLGLVLFTSRQDSKRERNFPDKVWKFRQRERGEEKQAWVCYCYNNSYRKWHMNLRKRKRLPCVPKIMTREETAPQPTASRRLVAEQE